MAKIKELQESKNKAAALLYSARLYLIETSPLDLDYPPVKDAINILVWAEYRLGAEL